MVQILETPDPEPTSHRRGGGPGDTRFWLRHVRHHLQVLWAWRFRHATELPYLPTEISIEVTNRCNFKCAFCPQSSPEHFDEVPRVTLTPERAGILLDRIRSAGCTGRVLHWTLDGEPFMNKQFDAIICAAAARGFTVHHFGSNGFFTTRERLAEFPRGPEHRYFVCTDFCSDPAYFEQYRGTEGSWQVVRDNLLEVLGDSEYASFRFLVTDISSYTIHDPALLESRFQDLQGLFPASERVTFHRRVFHNMCGFLATEKTKRRYNLCPYPWFSFHIASNGDVVACCRDLEHKTVLGNLFEQEMREIWNGAAYRELRKVLLEERPEAAAACVGCDMPYDDSKFSWRNMAKTAAHRALLVRRAWR